MENLYTSLIFEYFEILDEGEIIFGNLKPFLIMNYKLYTFFGSYIAPKPKTTFLQVFLNFDISEVLPRIL